MKVLAILGSAREDGDTQALLDAVVAGRALTRIDLRLLHIQHYQYGGVPERDDFGQVIHAMLDHRRIVFVTPVYWYAMSGYMKVLFDRFTDLVSVRKDLGRQLAGRTTFVLACGSEPALPEGFEVPFRSTSEYLDMAYGGAFYARTGPSDSPFGAVASAAARFGNQVFAEES